MRTRRLLRLLSLAILLAPAAAAAQAAPAAPSAAGAGRWLVGRVLRDSLDLPIVGAQVGLPALGMVARSDTLGRFAFPSRVAEALVIVRVIAVGFEPIETTLELQGADTAEVDFILSRTAQNLGRVLVSAKPKADRRLVDFERRRELGVGQFFGDSAIQRHARAGRLTGIIRSQTSLQLVTPPGQGSGTEQYVVGGRGSELRMGGGPRPCYSAVLLNGVWVYSGQPGEPRFNLNSIAAETVLAMEIYRSTAVIPSEYKRLGDYCGLIVIWLK